MSSLSSPPTWLSAYTITLNRLINPIGTSYTVILGTRGIDIIIGEDPLKKNYQSSWIGGASATSFDIGI